MGKLSLTCPCLPVVSPSAAKVADGMTPLVGFIGAMTAKLGNSETSLS